MAKNNQPKEPTFIEKLNADYTKESAALARLNAPGGLKDQVEQWERDLHNLKTSYMVQNENLKFAKSKNDKGAQKRCEQAMENLKKQAEALKQKIEKAQTSLSEQQKKVDAKIEELSKDPDTKKRLDSILYKQYDRKRKLEANKKESLQTIQEIADNHPSVMNLLKGIEGYNKTITQCNRVIKTLGGKSPLTPEEQNNLNKARLDLPVAMTKLADRQNDLKAYLKKNCPDMVKNLNNFDKFVEGIHSYGDLNRQMRGCDKTIANCTKAMGKLEVSKEVKAFSNASHDTHLPAVADENKPSWLHPFKRIKYIIDSRRAKREAENPDVSKNEQRRAFRDELKLSKDEYKSDIVQKYLENYDKGLHEASKSNRGNGNSR